MLQKNLKRIQNQVQHPRWTLFIPEFISTFLLLLMSSESSMDGVYIVVIKQ